MRAVADKITELYAQTYDDEVMLGIDADTRTDFAPLRCYGLGITDEMVARWKARWKAYDEKINGR